MENDKTIIVLLIIIVAMIAMAFVMFNPFKENVNLAVTSAASLNDGDNFEVSLSTSNGVPIANAVVDIIIVDSNGVKNPQKVTTDGSGKGKLQMNGLTPGTYNVTVSFSGNDKYASNSISQNMQMNEAKTTPVNSGGSSSSSSSSGGSVTLELNAYDQRVSKTVGEYKVESMKWRGTTVGGLGIWVYKNGQMLDKSSYQSRGYMYNSGQWKWSQWDDGEEGATYHKYPVSNDVLIEKVEVKF